MWQNYNQEPVIQYKTRQRNNNADQSSHHSIQSKSAVSEDSSNTNIQVVNIKFNLHLEEFQTFHLNIPPFVAVSFYNEKRTGLCHSESVEM